VIGRDSVPVAISIVVAVSVAAHEPVSTDTSSLEASSVEAAAMEPATTMEATALETSVLSRSRVCAGCSEGG
jgi:hypothetical protein